MQSPHSSSKRILLVFATAAAVLAPLAALSPRSCGGCTTTGAARSACCPAGKCRCHATDAHSAPLPTYSQSQFVQQMRCLLGDCGGGCECRNRSELPRPLERIPEPPKSRSTVAWEHFAWTPATPAIAATEAALTDVALLCREPPGGHLRWHAYLSVWRN